MDKTEQLSRRRFIRICAAALSCLGASAKPARADRRLSRYNWTGEAMGAVSTIEIATHHIDDARKAVEDCVAEIRRLEGLFSLYRRGSALSVLNRQGALEHPPSELLDLLRFCDGIHHSTGGAFDVTVQPLWRLYFEHFADPRASDRPPDGAVERARSLIDQTRIVHHAREIRFLRPGMAITLNGVAQGYVSDRIAARLKAAGMVNVLVDIGEIVALGRQADGRAWQIGILDPRSPYEISDVIELEDKALATSGAYGMRFDAQGLHHHLLDPKTGRSAAKNLSVTVSAPSAALADALSTGFSAMDEPSIRALVPRLDGVSVLVTRLDGTSMTV